MGIHRIELNNLYWVQDGDRPMHVVAKSWTLALERWKVHVAAENDILVDDMDEPYGISLVAESDELLLPLEV